jgi:hypothetical protein
MLGNLNTQLNINKYKTRPQNFILYLVILINITTKVEISTY